MVSRISSRRYMRGHMVTSRWFWSNSEYKPIPNIEKDSKNMDMTQNDANQTSKMGFECKAEYSYYGAISKTHDKIAMYWKNFK